MDVNHTINKTKSNQLKFHIDKTKIVHTSIDHANFTTEDLNKNTMTLFHILQKLRPTSIKKQYFQQINISTTIKPNINIDTQTLAQNLKKQKT